MREGRGDGGISDIAGTLMMVGVVVLAGGLLTVVVTDTLSVEGAPAASFALAPLEVGDTALFLTLKHGSEIPLEKLAISLQRGDLAGADVPPSDWSAPDAKFLRAGDRLTLPLSPAAGEAERIALRVTLREPTATLATLSATTGSTIAPLGPATLTAEIAPATLFADGVAAARVSVRVSHPAGAAAIASLVADMHALGFASGTANSTSALNDAGLDGDALGGDGVWTALLRPPASSVVGSYTIPVNATDLDGRAAGRVDVVLGVTGSLQGTGGGGTGGSGGGSVTGGTCYGCVVVGGASSYEGTRLQVPEPSKLNSFRLTNWSYDLRHPERLEDDAIVVRVVNNSTGWSAYFKLDYVGTQACIVSMDVWSATRQTLYTPRNGTCLPLEGLNLNMTDPVAELQMVRASGHAHPEALYQRSGLTGNVTFILAYMRDEDPTGEKELAEAIGIYSVDVVMK